MTKPIQTKPGALSSRCMLIDLSISVWLARLQDKKVAAAAIKENDAQAGTGKFHKYLINPEAPEFEAVKEAERDLRAWHYLNTLPWTNTARVLASVNYLTYSDGFSKRQTVFHERVDEFIKAMPKLREEARNALGKMFDETQYPTDDSLRSKFGVSMDIYPLPDAGDFRVSLTDDAVEAIRQQITENVKSSTDKAMGECWTRLHGAVANITARLSDPESKFRDSLIGNLREICELLPRLNIAGDQHLEQLGREAAEKLGRYEPEALREDKVLRSNVAKEANALAKKMASYFGGAQ